MTGLRVTNLLAAVLVCVPIGGRTLTAQEAPLAVSCATFLDMTEAELIDRFGRDNVRTDTLQWGGEYRGLGTVLFSDDANARLEIIWRNPQVRRSPYMVVVRGERSRWRTTSNIEVGMDLQTLERLNRRPFRLAGFQTEQSGVVLSWAEGRLEASEDETCNLRISLQPRWDGTEDFELVRQVRSGPEYSSGHPAMQKLNPRVVSLVLQYAIR